MSLFGFLFIGLITGWLACLIVKGGGLGLPGNLAVGMLGALLGGYLFQMLAIQTAGFLGFLVAAAVGAILVLFVAGFIKQKIVTT